MVVARSADVGVKDRRGLARRTGRRLPVELVVEDRAHRAVGQGADLDRPRGRRLQASDAERPRQADDAEAGAESLVPDVADAPGSARIEQR